MKHRFNPEYYWFTLFALCFIIFQLISDKIRPDYRGDNPALVYFLGVAPNFFPAIGIPALFVMIIPYFRKNNLNNKWLNEYKHFTANSISVSGLITWEFIQMASSSKLHFDWNDILWTLFGAAVFQLIWMITPIRYK